MPYADCRRYPQPPAGLTPSRLIVDHAMKRLRDMSKASRNLLWSVGFLVMVSMAYGITSKARMSHRDLVSMSGTAKEVGRIGRAESEALRFLLEEHGADFRIDPMYFRIVTQRSGDDGIKPGDVVRVTVARDQIRSPASPPLGPSNGIVWVYGLTVNARVLLTPQDIKAADDRNRFWGEVLIALALLAVGYCAYRWRRERAER